MKCNTFTDFKNFKMWKQKTAKWYTPWRSTRTLFSKIISQNLLLFHGACVNVVPFRTIGNVLPALHRLSLHALHVLQIAYIELHPNRAISVGREDRNALTSVSKVCLSLRRVFFQVGWKDYNTGEIYFMSSSNVWFSLRWVGRNSQLLNFVTWRSVTNFTPSDQGI